MPQDTQQTDWIEWQGGDCPVGPRVRVDVRFRDLDETHGIQAMHWAGGENNWWRHESPDHTNDIIAYRVVQA